MCDSNITDEASTRLSFSHLTSDRLINAVYSLILLLARFRVSRQTNISIFRLIINKVNVSVFDTLNIFVTRRLSIESFEAFLTEFELEKGVTSGVQGLTHVLNPIVV